jgi:CHAT domain-containing protein
MRPTPFLVLCACILAIGGTAFAQESSDVESVIRRLYERYAAGDIEGAMALWSPTGADRDAFRIRISGIVRVRCIELGAVAFTRMEIEGNRATADVTVPLVKWSRHTGVRREETELATVTLDRDPGGAWRLTGWKRQEEALAGALATAKTVEERRALLAAQRRLITPTLTQLLDRRATDAVNQQRFEDATALARLIEEIAGQSGDLAGLASARAIDSMVYRRQKRWDLVASLAAGRDAVALAEASGSPDWLARALYRLGRTEWEIHAASDAKVSYLRGVQLIDDVEDVSSVALAAGGLAQHYSGNDRRSELHYALIALDLATTSGDLVARVSAELHVSGAYNGVNDCALAVAHYVNAVELSHKGNITGSVPAEARYEEARCRLILGDEEGYFRALRQGAAERGDTDADTTAFGKETLATYYYGHGDYARAVRVGEEALRLARNSYRTSIADAVRMTIAAAKIRQGHAAEALALLRPIVDASGRASHLIARADRLLGRRDDAYRRLRKIIRDLDTDLDELAADERERELGWAPKTAAFIDLCDMLVEDGRVSEALAIAERVKGRALLDVLRGGRRMAEEMMSDEERRRQHDLEERVAAVNLQLRSAERPLSDEAALMRARRDLEEYRAILYAKYPRLKRVQQTDVPVVTRDQVAELLPRRSAAFLEYVVSDDRTNVFLVRRTAAGVSVRCRTIRISQKRLAARVDAFVGAVSSRDRLYAAGGRSLYQLLLGPFEKELRGVETLCVVPDGPLWHLPFEPLLAPDGRFFVERMAVLYAPSITVYREMAQRARRGRAPGAFLAFADPPVSARRGGAADVKLRSAELAPLPDAAREVRSIGTLFREAPVKIYVGPDALESRAKAECPRYAVIHFATHGVLDDQDPMFSHLVLAPRPGDASEDGLLETWEMMQLDLHADLAVLSACDTAGRAVHAGEGLIGMAWALSVAGTSSTIVTQWKISSSTAADLMVDFYREWLRARPGQPFAKAEALRRARLHVMADPAHRHPFYWSAFVLIGSGS